MKQIKDFLMGRVKKDIPDIKSGDTVRVFERIKEGKKERVQVFEGLVLGRKSGSEGGATIIVRKVVDNVGVEKIFPLHSPTIEKIEIKSRSKVRRAKLYFLRGAKGKRAKLKREELKASIGEVKKVPEVEAIPEEVTEETASVVETPAEEVKPEETTQEK
jgi:large subunit ribosomal protein L19